MSTVEAKGGRSLSQAIIFGLLLSFAFLASVLVVKELFIFFIATAIAIGCWELSTALRQKNWHVPRIPVTIGSLIVIPLTYWGGEIAQWMGVLAIVAALVLWRSVELFIKRGTIKRTFAEAFRDFSASAFVVIYLPLTMSFAALLFREPARDGFVEGKYWIITFVTTVIIVDSSAYLFGRKLGKHPMLPKVSPKKSWEGFFISALFGLASAILQTVWLLQLPWWLGVIFAGAILMAAVLGDFAESLIKRDLGVKDMSSLIPGHGGMMDRLDSMLPAALMSYLLMVLSVRFL